MDIPTAGAVVFDADRRLLLVRRGRPPGRGLWTIPGGKSEPGETAVQTCLRELREETGLSATVLRLLGTVRRPAADGNHFVISDFLCANPVGNSRPGDDAADLRWCSAAELGAVRLVPGLVRALAEWDAMPS